MSSGNEGSKVSVAHPYLWPPDPTWRNVRIQLTTNLKNVLLQIFVKLSRFSVLKFLMIGSGTLVQIQPTNVRIHVTGRLKPKIAVC